MTIGVFRETPATALQAAEEAGRLRHHAEHTCTRGCWPGTRSVESKKIASVTIRLASDAFSAFAEPEAPALLARIDRAIARRLGSFLKCEVEVTRRDDDGALEVEAAGADGAREVADYALREDIVSLMDSIAWDVVERDQETRNRAARRRLHGAAVARGAAVEQ